jgi:hypothetical protein
MRPVFLAFYGWCVQCLSSGTETTLPSYATGRLDRALHRSITDHPDIARRNAISAPVAPRISPIRESGLIYGQNEGIDTVVTSTSEGLGESPLLTSSRKAVLVQHQVDQIVSTHHIKEGWGEGDAAKPNGKDPI